MNPHRQAKNKQLTQLASKVKQGVIVELGTYRGEGTIAICQGSIVPVYTIDDYEIKRGWANEPYGKLDRQLFLTNYNQARINAKLIQADVLKLASIWNYGDISLLFWDLGVENRLQQDFDAWQSKVTGKIVIHDTNDNRLGSAELKCDGWSKEKVGVFWIVKQLST